MLQPPPWCWFPPLQRYSVTGVVLVLARDISRPTRMGVYVRRELLRVLRLWQLDGLKWIDTAAISRSVKLMILKCGLKSEVDISNRERANFFTTLCRYYRKRVWKTRSSYFFPDTGWRASARKFNWGPTLARYCASRCGGHSTIAADSFFLPFSALSLLRPSGTRKSSPSLFHNRKLG